LPDEFDEQSESARPFWSGTITFGLVSIPVNLFPANRSSRASLRMLGPTGKPLARRYYSEESGRDLTNEDLVRGYEIKKNRFVEITDEELDRLAPERSRDINLQRFVDESSIPRLYFERGYFLTPASSTRAYHLLAQAMAKTKRAGIATFVMRGKEYLVAITADNGILRAETMRFHDEVRSPEQIGLPKKQKPAPASVRAMENFIAHRSRASLPVAELRDKASDRLLKLVERKRKRDENVVTAPGKTKRKAEVVDLLDVLRQSLAQSGKTKGRASRSK
jgi:DNA end-binding protein Ku